MIETGDRDSHRKEHANQTPFNIHRAHYIEPTQRIVGEIGYPPAEREGYFPQAPYAELLFKDVTPHRLLNAIHPERVQQQRPARHTSPFGKILARL